MNFNKKVFDKYIIAAKQVGILYHHTSYSKALSILSMDHIKASYGEGSEGFVSTTRNKNLLKQSTLGLGGVGAVFVLDGNKLSNNYKIVPWKYSAGPDASAVGDEDEERIMGTKRSNLARITNIKSYIIEIKLYETYFDKNKKDYDVLSMRFFKGEDISIEDLKKKIEEYGIKCSIIPKGKVWA
jgi:hypothetical protein